METVVIILMVLVCFSFVLKQTFHRWVAVAIAAAVCAFFVGLIHPWAIEQSKTQIADWLANPALMLDTSVVLCIEVMVNIAFCLIQSSTSPKADGEKKRLFRRLRRVVLAYFNVLIFPVLFFLLVETIFAFTGVSFSLIAWSIAGSVLILIPLLVYAVKWLLPEKDIRLEMLFLINTMIAILGIIATVNGRTAVAAVGSVDWCALVAIIGIVILGTILGIAINHIKTLKLNSSK